MKKYFLFIFFPLMTAILLSDCTMKPTVQVPVATATQEPSRTPAVPWKVVRDVNFEHTFLYAGFIDESFGLILGTVGSGHNAALYNSTDGGTTWSRGENASQFLFALDIVDNQVAWSCGGAAYVRKSIDGGKTWQAVADFGASEPNQCRYLSFLDATTGWAASPTILGMTTDGGQTWKDLPLPTDISNISAIALRSASVGYLLDSAGKLYSTADAGQTWTDQELSFAKDAFLGKMPSPVVAMRFMDELHGMIALQRGNADSGFAIWSAYTNDGGKTWRTEQVPLDTGIFNLFLSHDGTLLTVINGGLHRMTLLQYQQP